MIPSPITDYGSLTDAADEGEAVNEKNAWAAQWMPIETAPKDGKFVLLWKRAPYSAADILRWESSISAWVSPYWDTRDEGFCGSLVPTHWMPLPPSPEEAEAARQMEPVAWLYPFGRGRYAATTNEVDARSASTDGTVQALYTYPPVLQKSEAEESDAAQEVNRG